MSAIIDETVRQLVINRIDDLSRLTINVNRTGQAVLKMAVNPGMVVLEIEQERRRLELAARLPGVLLADESLEEIEQLINDAAVFLGVTPAAIGVHL